jgi:DNA repair exonuclease SbcCD nuclease subunit
MNFSFIHAADLHLGSPFVGLRTEDSKLADLMTSASRDALDGLVTQAIELKVGFFVIAGDVYDGDWKDTTIGLFFHRQMSRLERAGIPVFLVRGNHDAESVITKAVRPPKAVRTFDHDKVQSLELPDLKVVLHGQSFSTRAVTTNLAAAYPAARPGWFNIGVLHTSCDNRPGHDNYAPCSLEELVQRGYQYWALGHVHAFEVLNEHPHIVYAGNLQGRNARECGDKGAVLVEVEDNEVSSLKRLPVSRVCWASLTIDLSDIKTEDEAFESYRQAISNEVTRSHQLPLICRVSIVGATPMHRHLHEDRGRLRDELKAAADQCREDIWLEDVRLATSEPITVHGAQANATGIDLSAMLSHILSSLELFDEAKAELHTITSKMPTAALAAELSDERIPCHRRAPYPKPESVDASGRRALSTPHRRELRRS